VDVEMRAAIEGHKFLPFDFKFHGHDRFRLLPVNRGPSPLMKARIEGVVLWPQIELLEVRSRFDRASLIAAKCIESDESACLALLL
jgi:hypothetical protein